MVIDKGLSLVESESLVEKAGDYIDMVKIGFVFINHKKFSGKNKNFQGKKINVFFGGTFLNYSFSRKN